MTTKKSKKSAKKTVTKKPAKKTSSDKVVAVKPVTDSNGIVTMKSIDDPGTASEGKAIKLKPYLDIATGVVTMVPVEE